MPVGGISSVTLEGGALQGIDDVSLVNPRKLGLLLLMFLFLYI